jgi:hypothetical protein
MLNKKIGIKVINSGILYFEYQNMTTVGTRIIAIKLDKEFGLPRVPIIPFVLESHLKKSNLKNCNKVYRPFNRPATTIPLSKRSILSFFIIIDEATRIIIAEKNVRKPSPLPIRPKMSCSIGDVLLTKIRIPSSNKSNTSTAKILLYLLAKIISLFLRVTGSKNKAKQNKIMNFGIINESLFKPGVIASVTATTEKIKTIAG